MGYLLVEVENGDRYRNFMQPMKRLRRGSRFFLLLFLGGGEDQGGFFVFLTVPFNFPIISHPVPNMFPKFSMYSPTCFP
jgi:hypothetical protein